MPRIPGSSRSAPALLEDRLPHARAIADIILAYLNGPPKRLISDIARETHIHRSSLSRYVNLKAIPDAEECRKLAPILGVSEDTLLTAAGHRSPTPSDDAFVPPITDPLLAVYFRYAGRLPPESLEQVKGVMRELYAKLDAGPDTGRPFFAQPVNEDNDEAPF